MSTSRHEADAAARLAATIPAGIPAPVLADAQRQLAGMLAGMAELETAWPAVADGATLVAGGDASPAISDVAAGENTSNNTTTHRVEQQSNNVISRQHAGPEAGQNEATGLLGLSLLDLAARIRRRELSPVDVTRAALDRIHTHDGYLHTFITVTAEQALDDARRAEQEIGAGTYRGPLHGVPLAAKDFYATRGIRTTCGTSILGNWVPDEDAVAIAAWKAGGAVLLGKNTLHEFAFGGTSVNAHTGTPRNPWNPERICGGSSGGSAAAVAAGFAYGALGSETGNSVRRPATFCGVIGLKPTFGRASRRGIFPLAWSLDHAGVFGRTVDDVAVLMTPLCGFDPADPGSRRPPATESSAAVALAPVRALRGRRVGVPRALLTGLVPDVARAFTSALDGLRAAGVEVRDVSMPQAERWPALVSSITMHVEAASLHAAWLRERSGEYGPDVLARLLVGRALGAPEYARAQVIRGAIAEEVSGVLREVDAIVAPGTPAPAPPIEAGAYVSGDVPWGTQPAAFQLQRLFSLIGLPAISVPAGLSGDGLPVAVQLAGRPWEEGLLLGLGGAIMDSVPAERRAPAIAPLAA